MTANRYCTPLLWLLLVISTTLLSLGTANIARSGCRGDSIQLFQNIKIDNDNTTVSLYRKNRPMVIWSIQSSVANATFANGYNEKLSFDKTGNLFILELQDSDEANYTIISKTGNTTWTDKVNLAILVEPDTRCKPKIIRGVDTLTTYLEPDGCGKPAAYAYFLEHPSISVAHNEIKLLPGQEAGTVYACINSPALRCAKNSKLSDYCTVFIHENKMQSKLSEISGVTLATLVITILYDGSYILVIIVLYRRLTHMLKKNANTTNFSAIQNRSQNTGGNLDKTERILRYLNETEFSHVDVEMDRTDEKLLQNTAETLSQLEEMETAYSTTPEISEKNSPHLTEEAGDYMPPHRAEQAIPQKDEIAAGCTPKDLSDPKDDTKEAPTAHQAGNDSETMRELRELRHAALCKICFANKMSIAFMPCKHIATCSNCSTSLQQCPVCRAAIKEKMTIHFDCKL